MVLRVPFPLSRIPASIQHSMKLLCVMVFTFLRTLRKICPRSPAMTSSCYNLSMVFSAVSIPLIFFLRFAKTIIWRSKASCPVFDKISVSVLGPFSPVLRQFCIPLLLQMLTNKFSLPMQPPQLPPANPAHLLSALLIFSPTIIGRLFCCQNFLP